MKIPKKIKIGAHSFTVELKELDGLCGLTNYIDGKILLDKRMPQTLIESTLVHEVFHVINATLGGNQLGHMLQDSLAEQIYQVLKDNKLLK